MRNKKVIKINRFDNFNDSNQIQTKMFYNYKPSNELKNSIGIKPATFPKNFTDLTEKELKIADVGLSSIDTIGYFKQYFSNNNHTTHRLIIYGNDKKLYMNQMFDDSYDLLWLYNLEFESAPIILTYKKEDKDSVIIASDGVMKIWVTGYSPYTINDVPKITSMCMEDGVLFCTIDNPAHKVWYATDLSPENVGKISTTSDYLILDNQLGDAKKVVTFNENVFIFRDYGISKINNIKGDISVNQIYQSNTRIFANTISVCGNSILFMTNDGLYSFNGVKVSKTKINILNEKLPLNLGAVSAVLGENYYLALKIDFKDEKQNTESEYINNVLLVINTTDFSYEIIRGVDIKYMMPFKVNEFEKLLILFNSGEVARIGELTEESKIFDKNLSKYWLSEDLFDSLNVKLITKLKVNADVGVKFKIKYDNKEIDFTTYKTGVNEFSFKIMAKKIQLEISTEKETGIVNEVELEFYEY